MMTGLYSFVGLRAFRWGIEVRGDRVATTVASDCLDLVQPRKFHDGPYLLNYFEISLADLLKSCRISSRDCPTTGDCLLRDEQL